MGSLPWGLMCRTRAGRRSGKDVECDSCSRYQTPCVPCRDGTAQKSVIMIGMELEEVVLAFDCRPGSVIGRMKIGATSRR